MRGNSPNPDRPAVARLASWLWALAAASSLALLAPATGARGQAPGPELFAKPPTTPMELWDAADYLVRTGQYAQAAPYLDRFVQAQPDDETLLKIQDRFGVGSVLRLEDYPPTRPFARKVAAMLADAQKRNATNPERIGRFIDALTKSNAEQDYAVERLRESGPYAVPFLVQALGRPGLSAEDRSLIVRNIGRLDTSAVPPLIATLDAADRRLVADVAAALGVIGDRRALPPLTFLAAGEPATPDAPPDPARDEARRAIARLTGRTFASQPRSPVRVLADEALRYHRHAVPFPDGPLLVWTWDPAQEVPVSAERSQTDAEAYFGNRFAREALRLDPSDVPAQVALLSLALEKAVERAGPAAFPADDPTGAFAAAMAAGPDLLGRVLRTALADGKYDLAAAAATALGRVTDRNTLAVDGRPGPLVEALTAPSRRVQFAAAKALVNLAPRHPFPGSSQVVPILARFANGAAAPRAVVIDGNAARGGQLVGFLKQLGYDPILSLTGADGFRDAAASADVELILLDSHLIRGDWRLTDTISNLRADARTAGIPITIVGPQNRQVNLDYMRSSFPGVKFLVTPVDATLLERQLGGRPSGLSDAERAGYAREAAALLAQVAGRPGSPFEPELSIAEPALTAALNAPAAGAGPEGAGAPGPESSASAAAALADVARPEAQRGLADALLDPSRPAPSRLAAADALVRSVQRFGPLLAPDQEARLLSTYDQEGDPALRAALAAAVGALRPKPELVGRRLQNYDTSANPSEAPPPAPAPATAPNPEAPGAPSPAPDATNPAPPAAEVKP